jgi:hypothetical protein
MPTVPGDATAEDISIQMTELSFLSGTEYFGQFFHSRSDLSTECSLVPECSTSRNRITISFTWPDLNQIPQVPPMEEKENAVFRKEYDVYGSWDAMYFQNDEHYFNKIQINENSFRSSTESTKATLFNRDGKEIGTFLWKAKSNQSNEPNKRRSFVRQASAHVRHVITPKQTQIPCSTCYRTNEIEMEMFGMTNISFGYLVLAEWVTTIAMIVVCVTSAANKRDDTRDDSILIAALVTWFFLQSALTFAAVAEGAYEQREHFMNCALLFLGPQGLFVACVLGLGAGEGLACGVIFLWMLGSLVFGVPLKLLGYPADTKFMEGASDTGKAFAAVCFAMAAAAASVFSFFAGTVYLLTTPRYTTIGLVITFGVLPLVVWPVAYIVVGAKVGLPVRPLGQRCGGSLFLCVLGIALFNLILPASLILFYGRVEAAPPAMVDKECVTLQYDGVGGSLNSDAFRPACNGKIIYEHQTEKDLLPSGKNQCDCKSGYVREGWFVCSKKVFTSSQTCTKCPNYSVGVDSYSTNTCNPYCKQGYARHRRLDQNNRTMFIPGSSDQLWFECRRCTNLVGIRRFSLNTCDAESCVTGYRYLKNPWICESINGSSTNRSSTNGSRTR